MEIWKHGLAFGAILLIIWALKSSFETRVLVSITVLGALIFFGTGMHKKR